MIKTTKFLQESLQKFEKIRFELERKFSLIYLLSTEFKYKTKLEPALIPNNGIQNY